MSDPFSIPNDQGEMPDDLDLSPGRFITYLKARLGSSQSFPRIANPTKRLSIVNDEGRWSVESIQ